MIEKMRSGTVQGAANGQILTSCRLAFLKNVSLSSGASSASIQATCSWGDSVFLRAASISSSSANSFSTVSYSALNAGFFIHSASISSWLIVIHAALPMVKSKWIASYGNTVPRSPRSSMSLAIRAVTSVWTPLISRPTSAAISRIVSSPAPAIAIRIVMRLGDSVLCINCQSGNEITSPSVVFAPSMAEWKADNTSALKLSIVSTRMVTVFISFSFVQGYGFANEVVQQLLYCDEIDIDLLIAEVLMVTFAAFVIVAHHANTAGNISHAVLKVVLAAENCGVNLPNNDSDVVCAIQIAFELSKKLGWHFFVSLRYVVNNNNNIVRCQTHQQNTVDNLNSGRYTAPAAAKSAAGRENPELVTEHNRSCGFFVLNALSHLSMVGRAGQPSGWPVSVAAGFSPLYVSPPMTVRSLGGELSKLTTEAATMATILTQTQPEITIVNGKATTTSLAIAEHFRKPHKDVLTKIARLDCSSEFTERNFSLCEYTDATGRKLPCYYITRDGFAFLAMGFTGKRAAQFKEAYINAFNTMEQELVQSSGNPHQQIHTVVDEARRIQDKLEEALYLWKNHVAPLKPPVLVGGLLLDAVCTADRLVGHAGKLERGEHVREGEVAS